jgi:hypothetical protein
MGMKRYWEIIADNLKKAGRSLGWVSAVDSQGRTVWIVDAHRGDGKRFIVHANEKLTAFIELASGIRGALGSSTGFPMGYLPLPARVRKVVFEKLDGYGLGPRRDRSSDAQSKHIAQGL